MPHGAVSTNYVCTISSRGMTTAYSTNHVCTILSCVMTTAFSSNYREISRKIGTGTGLIQLNLPGGSTLQCGMWRCGLCLLYAYSHVLCIILLLVLLFFKNVDVSNLKFTFSCFYVIARSGTYLLSRSGTTKNQLPTMALYKSICSFT